MYNYSVLMDCRPMIIVVEGGINHFTDGWEFDKYERKRKSKYSRKKKNEDIYCKFDNSMISVSTYFICPKFVQPTL